MSDGPRVPVLRALAASLAALVVSGSAFAAGGGSPGRLTSAADSEPAAVSEGAEGGQPVTVSAVASREGVVPGGELVVAVVLDHEEHWHTWPSIDQDVLPPVIAEFTIRTEIGLAAQPTWIERLGPIQWPKPELSRVVDPTGNSPTIELPAYQGEAVAFLPLIVAETAALGPQSLDVVVSFQTCDDRTCLAPETLTIPVSVNIVDAASAAALPGPAGSAEVFASFDQSVFAAMRSGKAGVKAVRFDIFGLRFSIDPSGFVGLMLLLLVAAVGGLLLNFTPCVLPVIPLKIMGLSASADKPGKCFRLGLVMSIGVVAFRMAIGLAIVSIAGFTSISSLFQRPWFSLAVGAFIGAMALGMFGIFNVRLPRFVYAIDPKSETYRGAFVFGIMTAVLSTPCTAPLMGTAAAWATTQPPGVTLSTFGAIGAGMALPYLLLAANPKWIKKVPKSGPASELVKQVMGVLMLAVAVFFIGSGLDPMVRSPIDPPFRAHWWLIAALGIAAGAWLVWRTIRITSSLLKRTLFGAVGACLALGAVGAAIVVTDHGPINWRGYTAERFDAAIASNKVVVLDFTAEWCLNCKALERAVLYREDVAAAIAAADVEPLKVDLIGNNPEGRARMKEFGRVAIPLLAIVGPGSSEPFLSDAYTPEQVLTAISQARGQTPRAAR